MIASHPVDASVGLDAPPSSHVPLSRSPAAGLAHHVDVPLLGASTPTNAASRSRLIHWLPGFQIGTAAVPSVVQSRFRGIVLTVAGLGLVVLIASLDYATGPHLSLGIFYLVPVVVCAWWSGFSYGILLSLGGAIAWHTVESLENPLIPFTTGLWNGIVRFGTLVLTSSLVSRLQAGVLRERLLARTDALTGAANGRTFYESALVESERMRRASRPLTLAYLDLDNFKQLNDRLGHTVGDAALVHAAQTIRLHLRSSDLLARLGGDEFALLLPEMGTEGAIAMLRRLQELLSDEMACKGWPVTLSVGAITFTRPTSDVGRMIQQVDALMYQAKQKGKGRVEHAVVEDSKGHRTVERP
jgi:diguanylate cyclase (GGDEF)-like protein